MSRGLVVPLFFMLTVATTAHTADLSTRQIEELTVFGLRAMGAAANTDDVKEILSPQEIEKLVRAGLNLQGRLCARITEIDPPQMEVSASYKLTCITHSGGLSKTNYYIEALQGISYDINEYSRRICKMCPD